MAEPYRVVSTAEMRALEQAAMKAGISEAQLQERAGREVAAVAAEVVGQPTPWPIVALVGTGNNGRDAMVASRQLANNGYPVALYLSPRHAVRQGELEALERLGAVWLAHSEAALGQLRAWLGRAPVAIDGLLGIGVHGPMRSPLVEIARAVNDARAARAGQVRVVSVDLPSGLDSDTGQAPGTVVQADVTVALGAVKAGTLRFPGAALAGRLEPRPIGLPPGLAERLPVRLLDLPFAATLVPPRPWEAHKGTFGSVLVLGGSRDYLGAPILAGLGAARSGCGLIGLAVPERVQLAAASRLPEATYVVLPGEGAASDPEASIDALRQAAQRFDVLVLGPGLGRSEGAEELVREVVARAWPAVKPIVVDADALTLLASWPSWWHQTHAPLVLTPHLGEMARLAGEPRERIAERAWEMASAAAEQWGQVVVLKSAHTVVAEPAGGAWVCPWANPALATGGSGDVLAGIVAGLLAQGLERTSAAVLGVALQAWAAAAVLAKRGWRTLLASDLAEEVPASLAALAASPVVNWLPGEKRSPQSPAEAD